LKGFERMTLVKSILYTSILFFFCGLLQAQPWLGIISPARATNWSNVGVTVPSGTWTQCGSTIAAYGSSSAPASASTINTAIANCASNEYVLLGAGDFYLSSGIDFAEQSNVVLRGQGANQTRLHFSGFAGCNGWNASVCLEGSNTYEGGYQNSANWTAGYGRGTTAITLDNVSGIVLGVTPIVLDQCNTGLSGSSCASGSQTDNSNVFVCDLTSVCESQTPATGFYRPSRAQIEVVYATAISGSGPYTVTISDPIELPNWNSTQAPQAWWGSATITNSGVENLLIDSTNNGGVRSISLVTASKCWVKGVASEDANQYHIFNYLTSHDVIRDSYAYLTQQIGTQSYGLGGGVNGALLIENNIIQQVVDPINFDAACSGCAATYNFAVNQYDWAANYMFGMFSLHAAGNAMTLFEGNIGDELDSDDIHGTHDFNTVFRNYFNGFESNNGFGSGTATVTAGSGTVTWASGSLFQSGWATSPETIWIYNPTTAQYVLYWMNSVNSTTSLSLSSTIHSGGTGTVPFIVGVNFNTDAIHVAAYSRYYNVIGNVIGSAGFHLAYACVAPNQTTSPCGNQGRTPYDIGYSGNTHGQSAGGTAYDDVLAGSTLMRWGNYDTVTGGVRWCGSSSDTGWSATCGSTSEIPTSDPYFPNSLPTLGDTGAGQRALPASFVYSSTPSWWPSGKVWPPIGPDVSSGNIGQCTGGTYTFSKALSSSQCTGGTFLSPSSTIGAHAVSIPAMDCYLNIMNGPPDGTGPMLSFSASSCYVQSGSGSGSPSPPISLTAVAK
jgi:hypothetical protein